MGETLVVWVWNSCSKINKMTVCWTFCLLCSRYGNVTVRHAALHIGTGAPSCERRAVLPVNKSPQNCDVMVDGQFQKSIWTELLTMIWILFQSTLQSMGNRASLNLWSDQSLSKYMTHISMVSIRSVRFVTVLPWKLNFWHYFETFLFMQPDHSVKASMSFNLPDSCH